MSTFFGCSFFLLFSLSYQWRHRDNISWSFHKHTHTHKYTYLHIWTYFVVVVANFGCRLVMRVRFPCALHNLQSIFGMVFAVRLALLWLFNIKHKNKKRESTWHQLVSLNALHVQHVSVCISSLSFVEMKVERRWSHDLKTSHTRTQHKMSNTPATRHKSRANCNFNCI